jgi:hypothetical protein
MLLLVLRELVGRKWFLFDEMVPLVGIFGLPFRRPEARYNERLAP